jgi:hypothetical protein
MAGYRAGITGDTLVKQGRTKLYGIIVTTATATAAIDIRDAVAAAGGTVIWTIPASTAAGVISLPAGGVNLDDGCFVDYAGTATGTLTVLFD